MRISQTAAHVPRSAGPRPAMLDYQRWLELVLTQTEILSIVPSAPAPHSVAAAVPPEAACVSFLGTGAHACKFAGMSNAHKWPAEHWS